MERSKLTWMMWLGALILALAFVATRAVAQTEPGWYKVLVTANAPMETISLSSANCLGACSIRVLPVDGSKGIAFYAPEGQYLVVIRGNLRKVIKLTMNLQKNVSLQVNLEPGFSLPYQGVSQLSAASYKALLSISMHLGLTEVECPQPNSGAPQFKALFCGTLAGASRSFFAQFPTTLSHLGLKGISDWKVDSQKAHTIRFQLPLPKGGSGDRVVVSIPYSSDEGKFTVMFGVK